MSEPLSDNDAGASSTSSAPSPSVGSGPNAPPRPPLRIAGESVVSHVTLYPRGAIVRRRVVVPAGLPRGAFELVVGGLPASADAASLRVNATGKRPLDSTHTRLVTPTETEGSVTPATTHRGQREALLREQRALELRAEAARTARQRARDAQEFSKENENKRGFGRHADPLRIVQHGEAMAVLLDEFAKQSEDERHLVERALVEVRRKLAALDLVATTRPALAADPLAPTLELRIEIGKADEGWATEKNAGETASELQLEIEYVVRAARYWPAYTVRFTDRGRQATLGFDPFVVQLSGEDWNDVQLSIATGDLISEATLPKLPSWRLGRAQHVKKLGYRALPNDSRSLFDDFDAAWRATGAPNGFAPPTPKAPAPVAPTGAAVPLGMMIGGSAPGSSAGGPPPAMAMPMLEAARFEADEADEPIRGRPPMPKRGAGFFAASASRASVEVTRARAVPRSESAAAPPDEALARPSDESLDFDRLVLASPQSGRRGRLVPGDVRGATSDAHTRNETTIQQVPSPPQAIDPRDAGLVFDHVFHGSGTVRVPSSPQPMRVSLGRHTATATPRLTVVPRETSDVFREADLDNPFPGPLLPGPLDVLQDGTLLAESTLPLVDRGGRARIGMGVEDRVKVARNVHVEEKSAGLLGGSRTVDHSITIDVVSALPFATLIEVRDRLPFAEEDADVEVKPGSMHPAPTARDTGGGLPGTLATTHENAIVRGGLIWQLPLSAAGETSIQFSYRLTFSAKDEIVGGNRRD
jgi:hypothetical protein